MIPWAEILNKSIEHLWLTTISLVIAAFISIPIGILISRKEKISTPVLSIINAIQTIPSLALLGFMIPLLGIGTVPAVVALFLYAMLPIVRNTYTGITTVDKNIKEAARGMGMSSGQLLYQVELPLSYEVIFAGIRTAFVINIGVATLCSLIGAGGLGDFIFRGISLNNTSMIFYGAIPASILALSIDALLGLFQKGMNIKRLRNLSIVLLAGVLLIISIEILPGKSSTRKPVAAFPSEFIYREDGYVGLKEVYDLDMEIKEMDVALGYDALKSNQVDVIGAYSTDGRIKAYDLYVLEDNEKYFPPYYAAPLIRDEIIEQYPELLEALNQLENILDDASMTELNFLADNEKQNPKDIAITFLRNKGKLTSEYSEGGGDIIIGSKNFTESFILSELFKVIIENYTSLTVEIKPAFGGTKLIFDALRFGEIDIYPEYTGTGYLLLLPEEEKVLNKDMTKDEVYNLVKDKFPTLYELTWLQPLGFNNTHAITVRRDMAEKYNLETIEDLSNLKLNQ